MISSPSSRFTALLLLLAPGLGAPSAVSAQDLPPIELEGAAPLLFKPQVATLASSDQSARGLTSGGNAVFGASISESDGGGRTYLVQRLDSGTGAVLWSTELDGGSSWTVDDLHLVSNASGDRVLTLRTVSGFPDRVVLAALDGQAGSLLWEVAPLGMRSGALDLCTLAGRVLVATTSETTPPTVHAASYATSDGSLLWENSWKGGFSFTDTYALDVVQSTDGSVAAVSWSRPGDISSSVLYYGVRVFQGASGGLVWKANTSGGPIALTPDGSVLALRNASGELAAVDAATGTTLWQVPLGFPQQAVEALAFDPTGQTLLVATDDDVYDPATLTHVTARRTSDGAVLWSRDEEPWGSGAAQTPLEFAVSEDGARLALYLHGGQPTTAVEEGLAVLFDTATGTRLGAVPVGSGMAPLPGGESGPQQRLAFASAPAQLLVLGHGAEGSASPTGQDLWIERLALPGGGSLPRFEVDALLGAYGRAADMTFDRSGAFAVFAGAIYGLGTSLLVAAYEVGGGALAWSLTGPVSSIQGSGTANSIAANPVRDELYVSNLPAAGPIIVRALDSNTGLEAWSTPVPSMVLLTSAPILTADRGGERVYVHTGFVQQLRLEALATADGSSLWSAGVQEGLPSQGILHVAADDLGRLYVLGRSWNATTGTIETELVVFDGATGAVLWTNRHGASDGGPVLDHEPRGLVVEADRVHVLEMRRGPGGVFVLWGDSLELRALDTATGTELFSTEHAFAGTPITANGLVGSKPLGQVLAVASVPDLASPNTRSLALVAFDRDTGALRYERIHPLGLTDASYPVEGSLDGALCYVNATLAAPYPNGQEWTGALDQETGELAWSSLTTGIINTYVLVASPAEDAVAMVNPGIELLGAVYGTPPLIGAPAALSLSAGGTQELKLVAGTAQAGDWHFVLGSASGTAPGIPLDGFTLPLNADAYLALSVKAPGLLVSGALGKLSASGMATAAFQLPAGAAPGLAGLVLNHAFATIRFTAGVPAVTSVSNAVPVTLVP